VWLLFWVSVHVPGAPPPPPPSGRTAVWIPGGPQLCVQLQVPLHFLEPCVESAGGCHGRRRQGAVFTPAPMGDGRAQSSHQALMGDGRAQSSHQPPIHACQKRVGRIQYKVQSQKRVGRIQYKVQSQKRAGSAACAPHHTCRGGYGGGRCMLDGACATQGTRCSGHRPHPPRSGRRRRCADRPRRFES